MPIPERVAADFAQILGLDHGYVHPDHRDRHSTQPSTGQAQESSAKTRKPAAGLSPEEWETIRQQAVPAEH